MSLKAVDQDDRFREDGKIGARRDLSIAVSSTDPESESDFGSSLNDGDTKTAQMDDQHHREEPSPCLRLPEYGHNYSQSQLACGIAGFILSVRPSVRLSYAVR